MTAVEWLEDCLTEQYPNGKFVWNARADIEALFKRAKKMEKQQQGYSEEEVIELLQKALTHKDDGEIGSLVTAQGQIRTANFHSWFEQFKKK
jgi:hypothetical protein